MIRRKESAPEGDILASCTSSWALKKEITVDFPCFYLSTFFFTLILWYNPLSLGPLLTADVTIRNGRIKEWHSLIFIYHAKYIQNLKAGMLNVRIQFSDNSTSYSS